MIHLQRFEHTALCAQTPALEPPLMITRDCISRADTFLLNRAHYHEDFFALYIVREGAGTHVIDDIPYLVSHGDVYVMRPGSRHLYTQCREIALDGVYFRPEILDSATLNDLAAVPGFGGLFVEEPINRNGTAAQRRGPDNKDVSASGRWLHLTRSQLDDIGEQIAELKAEWASAAATVGRASIIRSLFVRLVIHLARYYGSSEVMADLAVAHGAPTPVLPSQRIREATVNAAIKHMRDNLGEPLRIEQISASVFLSPDHFSKTFTAVLGQSPNDYLRRLRVEEAKRLLTMTDESITSIAISTGFAQAAYFTRVFRALAGCTPREFRAGYRREQNAIPADSS
jgi:AraC-like DNA-binding protein